MEAWANLVCVGETFSNLKKLNPHFAAQNGNGFNPDVELLRVCETFSFLDKLSKPLAVLSRSEAGFFH